MIEEPSLISTQGLCSERFLTCACELPSLLSLSTRTIIHACCCYCELIHCALAAARLRQSYPLRREVAATLGLRCFLFAIAAERQTRRTLLGDTD